MRHLLMRRTMPARAGLLLNICTGEASLLSLFTGEELGIQLGVVFLPLALVPTPLFRVFPYRSLNRVTHDLGVNLHVSAKVTGSSYVEGRIEF
jgi:uncharacterized protein (DUF58 family)